MYCFIDPKSRPISSVTPSIGDLNHEDQVNMKCPLVASSREQNATKYI